MSYQVTKLFARADSCARCVVELSLRTRQQCAKPSLATQMHHVVGTAQARHTKAKVQKASPRTFNSHIQAWHKQAYSGAMHRDVAPNKMHDTKQKINLIIDAIVKANTNLTGRSAAALGKRTSKGRIASLEANYAAAKGRPAPEDLQLIGLPTSAARSGHQKYIPMLEHCRCFSSEAREDLGVSACHMGVIWCEGSNMHDPVVLRRVG